MLRNPRILFYFLLLLFALPILASWFAFQHPAHWIKHTTNHGTLLNPMGSLLNWPLADTTNHQPLIANQIPKKWLMLLVNQGECDKTCEKSLYNLRQIQIATGKYQNQIARIYIGIDQQLALPLQKQYPQLMALMSSTKDFSKQHIESNQIFLADPRGNIILSYHKTEDPEDIYHDLMHLLEINS